MRIIFFLKNYWKSISITGAILYLSFTPPSTFQDIPSFENEDKFVHILIYLGLTCILILDHKRALTDATATFRNFFATCFFFPVLLGGLIEILQPRIASPRTASWYDWLGDIAGVVLGWGIMYLLNMKPQFRA
ncbi:MAG TPA: hypothetical protein VK152_03015 [Paludibacter sp.]|nr:hypothetical protein [Paludibacter sp.]